MEKYFNEMPALAAKFLKKNKLYWNGKAVAKMSGNMRIFLEKDISAKQIYEGGFYALVGPNKSGTRFLARVVIDIERISVLFEDSSYGPLPEECLKYNTFSEEWISFVMQNLKDGRDEYYRELVKYCRSCIEDLKQKTRVPIDLVDKFPYKDKKEDDINDYDDDEDMGYFSYSSEVSWRFSELSELHDLEGMLEFIEDQYEIATGTKEDTKESNLKEIESKVISFEPKHAKAKIKKQEDADESIYEK